MGKDLTPLAEGYETPIEVVQEKYDQFLAVRRKDFPGVDEAKQEQCAYQSLLAFLYRKVKGRVRVMEGMLFGCEGNIRDWERREYNRIRNAVNALGGSIEAAEKAGLVNARGEPIYTSGKKIGQVVNDRAYFEVDGFVFEKDVPKAFRMFITNRDLLPTVVLNRPVKFTAEVSKNSGDGSSLFLNDVEKTYFEYFEKKEIPENFAMNTAAGLYPVVPVKDLHTLITTTKTKDKDEKEVVTTKIDGRSWMIKDLVLVNVHKFASNSNALFEFTNPDLLKWGIFVYGNQVKTDCEPIKEYATNVLARMRKVDAENQEITLTGLGMWQEASVRPKVPMSEFNPNAVKITFKI